jgi:hypothetical protein
LLKLSIDELVLRPGAVRFHMLNVRPRANTLFVYSLSMRLLGGGEARGQAGNAGAGRGLLFAVHPVQTEAADLPERRRFLMAFFYLASLWSYVRGVETGRAVHSTASPLLFLLALATRESAVTLPRPFSLELPPQGRARCRRRCTGQAAPPSDPRVRFLRHLPSPVYRRILGSGFLGAHGAVPAPGGTGRVPPPVPVGRAAPSETSFPT